MRQLTVEQFIDRAIAKHGDKYDYRATVYRSAAEKLEIGCPVHGSFWQKADNHLLGKGCPICGWQPKTTYCLCAQPTSSAA